MRYNNTMKLKVFSWMIIFGALLNVDFAWSMKEVRLLKTSPAQEILLFNLGQDYFSSKYNDLAALIDEEIISGKKFEAKKVMVLKGIVKLVKMGKQVSAWRVIKLPGNFDYKPDKKYILISFEDSLKGRDLYDISGRKIVSSDLKQAIRDYESFNDSSRLAHLKPDYILADKVKTQKSQLEKDFELPDLSTWEGKEILTEKEIFRSPHEGRFRQAKRLETFETMVGLFLDVYNDPDFDFMNYYFAQRRTPYNKELKADSDIMTEEESYWYKKRIAAQNKAKYMREIQSKGESWSEDFNDDELEEAVINIGLASERKRQTEYSLRRFDYLVHANLGFNLKDNAANTENSGNNKFHFAAGIEMFPFKRFVSLSKVTFAIEGRYALDTLSEANNNTARVGAASLGFGLNYYFLKSAQTIKEIIPFVGAGIRMGWATLKANTGESGTYNVYSLPTLNLGMTYNLRDGQGYRFNLGVETINLNLINGSANISDRVVYEDARIGFAWTKLL